MEVNMRYFEISGEWMRILGIRSQRQRVGKIDGIDFIIHPNEQGHNLGHLHAKYQGCEVVISIPDGKVLGGNISPPKQKEATNWVVANKDYLTERWNELTNGVKIPVI